MIGREGARTVFASITPSTTNDYHHEDDLDSTGLLVPVIVSFYNLIIEY